MQLRKMEDLKVNKKYFTKAQEFIRKNNEIISKPSIGEYY